MKINRIIKVVTLLLPLLFFSLWSFGQTSIVSGTVTDENGDPLPSVSIYIEGTTTGTISDAEGSFSLSVPTNSVLVFTYMGYLSEKITVTDQTVIDVSLVPDIALIDQIIVVGYGTQRKEAVTGSVASIRGNEMREVPSMDVSQALQGRIAGVEMMQTSSKPGETMQIRIRGTRSLTASNDPLVVLDGIPFAGSLTDINPNDIKSIDILKDASSTAIYGSRGANGVILITTKTGQKQQKATVRYDTYFGMKNAIKFPMMDGPEFAEIREAAGMYTNGADEFDSINTDWQDLLYRRAIVTNHDLSVSGGTESGVYNFGVGYYLDQAVIPSQQYERYSLRGSLDQEIGESFRFGFTSNNNYSLTQGTQIGLYTVLSLSPLASPYNADGTLKRTIRMPLDEYWMITEDVINEIGDQWMSQTRVYATYNNLYGELKIPGVKGLNYRINIGLNLRQRNGGGYAGEGINNRNPSTPSSANISNALTTNWVIENLMTYDRTFNQKHQVNLVGLYSSEETVFNNSYVSARDIPADAFQFYNLGQAAGEIQVPPNDEENEDGDDYDYQRYERSGLISWMGRIMYSYDNRYMLMATLRSDGSSRLAEGRKWHTYPAVSVGWNMKNESFMDNVTPIDLLKLRVGYGQTSNQAVDPYATLGILGSRPYNFGDEFDVGYYVSNLPNENLGWEYSETWNYGLDFSLFNTRLSGTIEYYVTNTKDILLSVELPRTSGVESYVGNIGETQNKGIEISLNTRILNDLNGWTWDFGFNLYSNRNRLIALASGTERDEANWWFVGHPINVLYDYEKVGIWQEEDPYLDILEPGGNVGMIKVKYDGDYNEDGTPTRQIGPDDRQIIHLDPKFQGGFNTRVSYKGFDLSIIGSFRGGGILRSSLYSSAGWLNLENGRRNNVKIDYWTPDNTGAKYPSPQGVRSADNPKYGSVLGHFDASYLKVRTMTLGYNLTRSNLLKNAGIVNLRIYVTAQNPFILFSPYHKESGMDIETNSYGNENAADPLDDNLKRILSVGANTPNTRNYLIGMNVTF